MKLTRFALLVWGVVLVSGCAMPSKTDEQVAGSDAPPGLSIGPNPQGGPSHAIVGSGAEGTAAGGYQVGRLSGPPEQPTAPAYPPGRMAPIGASGSGDGDLGHPIPPSASLQTPPDPSASHF